MSRKKIETPVADYKRGILKYLRQFWKSNDAEIWCGLYTFIRVYTENERGGLCKEVR